MEEKRVTTENPVPVTIITGFLGSGKTTLLNRILTGPEGKRMAVIQNEFGEIGIDHELVVKEEDGLFEMQNGCICCTVRDDLIRALENLKTRKADFDRILIETTGLADPVPVAQTFFSSIHIQRDFRLDGIITLVDAKHALYQLQVTPEAEKQVLCADIILLNKTDLVESTELEKVEMKIREINPEAQTLHTTQAEVDIKKLFSISPLLPEKLSEIEKSLDHHTHHEEEVVHVHEHTHDEEVSSLSLQFDGFIDLQRLDAWLNMLGMLQGGDIYRMKGILNLPDENRRFVFQAVFQVMQGDFGREWKPGEDRTNKFVFIGKNLNKSLLEDGFKACLLQDKVE